MQTWPEASAVAAQEVCSLYAFVHICLDSFPHTHTHGDTENLISPVKPHVYVCVSFTRDYMSSKCTLMVRRVENGGERMERRRKPLQFS